MTTRYRLNRVVTVSGASAETEERPISWRFDYQDGVGGAAGVGSTSLPSVGRYAFTAGQFRVWQYIHLHDSDALLSFGIPAIELGAQSVFADGTPNTTLPRIEVALKESALAGVWIRFRPERLAADNFVEWVARGRSDYFASQEKFQEYFFVDVHSPTLSGDSFSWERDEPVIFSIEGQTLPVAASATADKKVWGRLDELGIVSGIVAVGGLESATASEETARLILRYHPAIAQGKSVTDDLGREWTVRSSRAIQNRRFLEFELFRLVA